MTTRAVSARARRRHAAGPFLLLLLPLILLVWTSSPASAHTRLSASDPTDGATRDAPVEQLTLTYSKPVELLGDTVTLRDGDDHAVEVARSDDGTVVTATFDPPLEGGSWVADWRVLASDGHPREGSIAFTVDAPVPTDTPTATSSPSPAATPPSDADDPATGTGAAVGEPPDDPAPPAATSPVPLEGLAAGARIVFYLGLLVAVGLVLFKSGPHRGEPERAWVLAGVTATVAAVAAVAGIVEALLHVGVVSGDGVTGITDGATLRAVGRTGRGTAVALRTLGLGLVALGAWRRARQRVPSGPDATALVGALLAIGSFQFVGHTNSVAPAVVVRLADATHAVAAAVWVGGIAGLALLARSPDRPARMRTAMRFSNAATGAVVAVGLGGVALAWTTMPTPSALWSTTWGAVLVTKLVLVAVLGAFGAHNHVRLVPRLAANDRSAVVALRQLRRTVRVEAVLMVAILALTAVLVGLSPV
jgi:copper transport protein